MEDQQSPNEAALVKNRKGSGNSITAVRDAVIRVEPGVAKQKIGWHITGPKQGK
jgi:hypothetical protein